MAEQPLLVLGKIRSILDAFTLEAPVRTTAQIREATGLPSSTAHRLLANLVEHGFLDRDGEAFRIGSRMAYWAGPATRARDLVDLLAPQLEAVRDATGETACCFRVEQGSRVCIGVAETRHGLRRDMYVGRIQPLHVGSAGRVLLAWDEALLDAVVAAPLPALTSATITDGAALRASAARTRARGYAITIGERVEAASGVSAPIFDPHARVVGALTVMGPTLRMPRETCEAMVDAVVDAARGLTASLGGRAPDAAPPRA